MNIKEMNLNELKPANYNPRVQLAKSDPAYKKLKRSIETYGFIEPLIYNEQTGNIVGGHQRYQVLTDMGVEKTMVSIINVNEEEEKALNVALNKIEGGWDEKGLIALLKELQETDDFELSGFSEDELLALLLEDEQETKEKKEKSEQTPEEEELKAKTGQVWKLGRHRLMVGDSTSKEDVAKLMGGEKADLIVTDPPYNVNYEGGTGMKIQNDHMGDAQFYQFLLDAYTRMEESARDGAAIYVFHADSEGYNFRKALIDAGFTFDTCCMWVKQSLVMGRQDYHWIHEPVLYGYKNKKPKFYGGKHQSTIWKFNKPQKNDIHPTMKPIDLICYPILMSTPEPTPEKTPIVLDLFGGSGSTIMAAEKTGRTGYSMELDPVYANRIIKRYEDETGNKAELEE